MAKNQNRVVRASVFAVAASSLLAVVLSAPRAAARPEYPGKLQTATAMTCSVGCTLCHTDPAGGLPGDSRLRSDAAYTLRDVALGIPGKDAAWLATQDSDMDKKSDLDELRAGTDPLSATDQLICLPEYGCFASRLARAGRTGGVDGAGGALGLAVAAVCALAGRRRRRS